MFKHFLLFLTFILFSVSSIAQCKASQRSKVLVQTLERMHYAPIENNEENQQRVAHNFFLGLDPYRVLFSETDVKNTGIHQPYFMDTLSDNNCAFIDAMMVLYTQRIKQFGIELNAGTSQAISFAKDDSITFGYAGTPQFASDDEGRKKRLQKLIRLHCLLNANEMLEDGNTLPELLKKNDAEIRETVKLDLNCDINQARQFENDIDQTNYLIECLQSAIAEAYDPHTEYFDAATKNAFSKSLSSDGRSFGLFISENENHEKVIGGLMPGGHAWRQNTVNVGDKILSVQLGIIRLVDFRCMNVAEFESLIDNGSENKMILELEKSSGEKQVVMIRKELVRTEDNVINGLLLEGNDQKVGYISLPAFYSSGSFYVDNGCANDVGKEILKMRNDGINGLIIDVRNNGGGDLSEAIELAGLFIDVGPMGMLVDRAGKPSILKELNKGVLYSGPLVIMINGFSASASEILAAVLQDYNRALLVGNASYGKSTAQRICPLHSNINQMNATTQPLAYVKVTGSMAYRITGNTHQKTGVQPHIALTDVYAQMGITEAAYPTSLSGSFVDKPLTYKKFSDFPLDSLRAKSNRRMAASEYEQYLLANKSRWQKKEFTLRLDPIHFTDELKKPEAFAELNKELLEKLKCPFVITAAEESLFLIKMDEYLSEVYEYQKVSLSEDFQLHETFNIMCDLISLQSK